MTKLLRKQSTSGTPENTHLRERYTVCLVSSLNRKDMMKEVNVLFVVSEAVELKTTRTYSDRSSNNFCYFI